MAERLPEEAPVTIDMGEASPPVEPGALEVMRMRRMVQSVDADALNSWDYDTLQLSTEDIIAGLCQMFIQLNLTRLDPDPLLGKRASDDNGEV